MTIYVNGWGESGLNAFEWVLRAFQDSWVHQWFADINEKSPSEWALWMFGADGLEKRSNPKIRALSQSVCSSVENLFERASVKMESYVVDEFIRQ